MFMASVASARRRPAFALAHIELPYNSVYKYRVEASGSTADYSAVNYDDSGWAAGPGLVGNKVYGDTTPPIGTPIAYVSGGTIWLRGQVNGPTGAISVEVCHDDTPSLWWNGEAVALTQISGDPLHTPRSVATIPAVKVLASNVFALKVIDTAPDALCAGIQMAS